MNLSKNQLKVQRIPHSQLRILEPDNHTDNISNLVEKHYHLYRESVGIPKKQHSRNKGRKQ